MLFEFLFVSFLCVFVNLSCVQVNLLRYRVVGEGATIISKFPLLHEKKGGGRLQKSQENQRGGDRLQKS